MGSNAQVPKSEKAPDTNQLANAISKAKVS
jgi:hypothetical protein